MIEARMRVEPLAVECGEDDSATCTARPNESHRGSRNQSKRTTG